MAVLLLDAKGLFYFLKRSPFMKNKTKKGDGKRWITIRKIKEKRLT